MPGLDEAVAGELAVVAEDLAFEVSVGALAVLVNDLVAEAIVGELAVVPEASL